MYSLFANCIPVKGHNRSIIYDLGQYTYHYIPNSLYDLLIKYETTNEWYNDVTPNEYEIIDEYINFLITNNLVLNCKNIDCKCFAKLNTFWETPEQLSIIALKYDGKKSFYLLLKIEEFIRNSYAKNLSINYFGNETDLLILLKSLKNTYVNNIELYLLYSDFSKNEVEDIVIENPAISRIILLGAKNNSSKYLDNGKQIIKYETTSNSINHPDESISFVVNRDFFIESQSFNCYYNKRIFIDEQGGIKLNNELESIDNVVNVKFDELLKNELIKKYWAVCKDKIEVCKDCEHRYMCYDSRLPKQNQSGCWFYETECGYNPYIAKWQVEEK